MCHDIEVPDPSKDIEVPDETFLLICLNKLLILNFQISDLSTTNNFLLDQNSQLRMTIKAATGDGSAQGGQNGQQQQNQSPVVSMDLPAATVGQQGTTITMTMEVPPSSMPQSMSLPVAQLVRRSFKASILNLNGLFWQPCSETAAFCLRSRNFSFFA